MGLKNIKSVKFSILVVGSIAITAFFAFAEEPKVDKINIIPTIVIAPDVYYPLEKETLYIEGKAVSNAVVDILIQQPGSKPIRFNIQADQNGDWVLTEKPKLESGEWEVRARIDYGDGSTSRWSNPRIVKSVWNAFQVFGISVKYSWLAILFFTGIVVASVFLVRVLIKTNGGRKAGVTGEIEEHFHREELQHEKFERTMEGRIQELKQETAERKSNESVAELKAKIEELERNLEIQKKLSEIEAQKKVVSEPIQYSSIVSPVLPAVSGEERERIKNEFEVKMKDLEDVERARKKETVKEAEEAQKILAESFQELRKDFQDQLNMLEDRSKYSPPGPEDTMRKNQILTDMLNIEKRFQELKESSSQAQAELNRVKKDLEVELKETEKRGSGFKPLSAEEEFKRDHLQKEIQRIERQISEKLDDLKYGAGKI